ncbi:hypothetical protein [Frateuria soli]|uniref:hypothetical protein n=1 Tax=Frateuria soli TaxID=1542730 RepID=UPI001E42950C|nr:hypothetical protein [Frateuria soli]UGB37567.1 hypothetical protein LQ771_12130 [Frateuria soli]
MSKRLLDTRKLLFLTPAVLLGLLLFSLVIVACSQALDRAPSFDGAMNLEVASSIANGDGYRRTYADRQPFPHEIQTGAPYVLPAAAVFAAFGVGIAQAQVVNIGFFLALVAASWYLAKQIGGGTLGWLAACTVVVTPGMAQFGFNGYGEVPALVWVLAATAIFHRRPSRPWLATSVAGLLLALAVLTKTVMLIGAGAVGICIVLELLLARPGPPMERWRQLAALVAAGMLALAAMEAARATALGGAREWKAWWAQEAGAIFQQAGVRPGFADTVGSLLAKFSTHLALLSGDYGRATWLTGAWLVLVGLAWIAAMLWPRHQPGKWSTLAILSTAMVYLGWWLLVTPTAKAWHRRILDGMICADLGMVMFAGLCLGGLWQSTGVRLKRLLAAGIVLALPLVSVLNGIRAWTSSQAAPDDLALLAMAKRVHALPADAYLFGIGWYSAPRVGLLSERNLLDFNDIPVSRLKAGRPVYFIQAPADGTDYLQGVRLMYGLSAPAGGYALLHASRLEPVPLVAGGAPVRRRILAADDYPYMRGFNEPEGANGRWLTDDNLILLRPKAGDHLEIRTQVPLGAYRYPGLPGVIVSFNSCPAGKQSASPGVSTLAFAIPPACRLIPGTPVNVRIQVDNLRAIPITQDARALSILGKEIGFVAREASPVSNPADESKSH